MLTWMVLVSGTGQAASQPPRDVATARVFFEEGVAAADAGDFVRAADRFERSYAIRPSPVVGYNLASALSRVGRLVDAAEHLRRILYDRGVQREVRSAASLLFDEVLGRVGRLSIRVGGAAEGASVDVDGRLLDATTLAGPVPVDPGRHRVALLRGGAEVIAVEVEVTEGELRTVRLETPAGQGPPPTFRAGFVQPMAEPAPAPGPAPLLATAEPPPRSDRRRVVRSPWLWTAVVAVAAGTVTAVTLARRSDRPDLVNGTLDPGRVEVGE